MSRGLLSTLLLVVLPVTLFVGWISYLLGWSPSVIFKGNDWLWYVGPLVVLWLVAASLWRGLWARFFFYVVGTWDPFAMADNAPPWIRRWWVKFREGREIKTRFGRGATGGFAGRAEVLAHRFEWGQVFLGRPKGRLRPIGISTEKHMVTIAGIGSGKSVAAVLPNILIHKGSLVCVDPKGELAAIAAARRGGGGNGVKGMGQAVYVVDPFGIVAGAQSACFNVFDEMARVAEYDVNRPVSYAGKIAEALVKVGEKEPYWDQAAQTLLRGLILYVFQGPADRRNLVEVRRLVMQGDVQAHAALAEDLKAEWTPFDALFEKMKAIGPGPYQESIASAAGSLLIMGKNQLGSVVSTAQEHTTFLDTPEIRRTVGRSDFLLEDLKTKSISIFLCMPLNAVSGKEGRWLRMFVLLLIDMMMRSQQAPKPPILLIIDEFPSLGRLDGIEIVCPVLRSYGVRFWAIGQDLEQFQKTYPNCWEGFIGGAAAVQFMGVTHPKTVEYMVKLLGRHVVTEWHRSGGGQSAPVRSERGLLEAEQAPRLLAKERGNQIIWRGDKRPLLLKITPYFSYLPFWYYTPDRRFPEKSNHRIWRQGVEISGFGALFRRLRPAAEPPLLLGGPREAFSYAFTADVLDRIFPPALPHNVEALVARVVEAAPPAAIVPAVDSRRFMDMKNEMWTALVSADAKEHQGVIMPYLRKHHGGRWPDGEDIEAWMAVYQHWQDERGPADKNAPPEKSWSDMIAPAGDSPANVETSRAGGGVDLNLSDQEKQWFGDALKKAQGEDALADLDKVIGLKPVKDQIRKTLNVVRLGQARDAAGLPRLDITHHLVFTGNPGTGKTMMARLTGRIYKQVGLLKSGHLISVERADLVGGYVGETAGKTRKVIDSAMDGILFIDEAYSLVPEDSKEDYGPEAIATLILAMENARDRLVVIVAGYRAEMKRFIDSNPGMASRFKTFIDFPDYSPEELGLMFQMRAASFGCHLSMDATVALAGLMAGAERGRGFGNGRMVRNVFEECVARQANRLAAAGGKVDVTVFEASDIPTLEELAAMKMP